MANANSQSLLDYLMVAPPGLPTERTTRARNTTNASYDYTDINTVDEWRDFTYPEIVQRWGSLLQQVQIASEPMPTSPPQPINAESAFYARFNTYIQSRLRRALRAGFQHLAPQLPTLKLTPISVDVGEAAQVINQFRPDIALYEAGTPPGTSPNRCPGDLKVLSQVNFYMKQHTARYGFILTDAELVPIKRLDANGNLLVARAIPWGAAGPGRLTILLGLWYLGMLAAADDDWRLL